MRDRKIFFENFFAVFRRANQPAGSVAFPNAPLPICYRIT